MVEVILRYSIPVLLTALIVLPLARWDVIKLWWEERKPVPRLRRTRYWTPLPHRPGCFYRFPCHSVMEIMQPSGRILEFTRRRTIRSILNSGTAHLNKH